MKLDVVVFLLSSLVNFSRFCSAVHESRARLSICIIELTLPMMAIRVDMLGGNVLRVEVAD
jgi:hypothetical protein